MIFGVDTKIARKTSIEGHMPLPVLRFNPASKIRPVDVRLSPSLDVSPQLAGMELLRLTVHTGGLDLTTTSSSNTMQVVQSEHGKGNLSKDVREATDSQNGSYQNLSGLEDNVRFIESAVVQVQMKPLLISSSGHKRVRSVQGSDHALSVYSKSDSKGSITSVAVLINLDKCKPQPILNTTALWLGEHSNLEILYGEDLLILPASIYTSLVQKYYMSFNRVAI
jgi:hypothetical protein